MFNEICRTAIHSIISVSTLFVFARLMGKKQIAQLSFFDYVIGISIGSIAAQGAVDPSIHYTEAITGLIIFTLFSIILSLVCVKSHTGRKILDGTSTILIENGKIMEKGLKKTRLTLNDLLEECRQKNAFDIADIEFAILETSGKLSVLLKSVNQTLTLKDMNIPAEYKGLCTNVIIDGRIMYDHLKSISRDTDWLSAELKKHNIGNFSDVLLAYADSSGNLHTHIKNGRESDIRLE